MRKSASGFTLLEMVIAVAIFAVIASISYVALSRYVDVYQHLSTRGEALRQVQQAIELLQQDLRFSVDRPVRNEYGDNEAGFLADPDNPPQAGELLRLTVALPDPVHPAHTRLARVAWRIVDRRLYRVSWPVLDRPSDSVPYLRRVLDGIEGLELRFINVNSRNEIELSGGWGQDLGGRPQGVEVLLTIGGTVFRRLLEIGGA